MKAKGLWKFAVRTWRRIGVLYIVGITISAFGMMAAGNAFFTMQEEKSQPSQLSVAAEHITDDTLAEIEKIDGVLSVTGVIDVAATLHAGEWKAELVIQGVKPGWLEGTYTQGAAFQDGTSMPYLVLNEAAVRLFTDADGKEIDEKEMPDWGKSVYLDGEKPLTVKVCGVIQDDSEEPKAYMSISQAKNTLLHMGIIPAYSSALIQTQDMGSEEQVLGQLAQLGLMGASTKPELQESWKRAELELSYLFTASILILLCAGLIAQKNMAMDAIAHTPEYDQLKGMGLLKNQIRRTDLFRRVFCTAVGLASGVVIALIIPSFIPEEVRDSSIFSSETHLLTYIIILGIDAVQCLFFWMRQRSVAAGVME